MDLGEHKTLMLQVIALLQRQEHLKKRINMMKTAILHTECHLVLHMRLRRMLKYQ